MLPAPAIYRFGEDLRVDTARMSVTRAGTPVALEPKAFDLLRFLLANRDRLVTKEELLETIWPDTFVTPNAGRFTNSPSATNISHPGT